MDNDASRWFFCATCACFVCCMLVVLVSVVGGGSSADDAACFAPQSLVGIGAGEHGAEGVDAAVSCAGDAVIVATADGMAATWTFDNGRYRQHPQVLVSANATSVSVTCDGAVAAVGGAGVVDTFTATSRNVSAPFVHRQRIASADATFGRLVQLSCERLFLGVAAERAAHVFAFNGTAFAPHWTVSVHAPIASLALSCTGNHLVVGHAGAVTIYNVADNTTRIISEKTPSFGTSVAVAGTAAEVVAVGAPNATGVRIFAMLNGSYQERAALHETSQAGFGASVALDATAAHVLVGAWSAYRRPGNVTLYAWNPLHDRFVLARVLHDPELGRGVAVDRAGSVVVAPAGGTATLRLAEIVCSTRAECPPC